MDIQKRNLDNQLWVKHFRYSVVISKILISSYFNIVYIRVEYLNVIAESLDIASEYTRRLSHS